MPPRQSDGGFFDLSLQRLVLGTKYLSPLCVLAVTSSYDRPEVRDRLEAHDRLEARDRLEAGRQNAHGLSSGLRRPRLSGDVFWGRPLGCGIVTVLEMSKDDDKIGDGTTTGVVIKVRPKTKKPALYKVIMLNDDYTPMEFVIHVLERFFSKTREEATAIMLHVHQRGVGICGVYTYEVAETKVTQVMDFARQHEHPLQCTLEKA